MTPLEVIGAARAWIETHGWKRGLVHRPGGPGCLSVAFAQSGATMPEQCAAWTLLRNKIGTDVVSWNDMKHRVIGDVYRLLDAVAADLVAADLAMVQG